MSNIFETSPCLRCGRVPNPETCENMRCKPWRKWFLSRWDRIHRYPRQLLDAPQGAVGLVIGGVRYAHPDRIRSYLETDPCKACICSEDLCKTPCRARQNWAKAREAAK